MVHYHHHWFGVWTGIVLKNCFSQKRKQSLIMFIPRLLLQLLNNIHFHLNVTETLDQLSKTDSLHQTTLCTPIAGIGSIAVSLSHLISSSCDSSPSVSTSLSISGVYLRPLFVSVSCCITLFELSACLSAFLS